MANAQMSVVFPQQILNILKTGYIFSLPYFTNTINKDSEMELHFEIIRTTVHRLEFQKAGVGRSECVHAEIPLDAPSLSKLMAPYFCISIGPRVLNTL